MAETPSIITPLGKENEIVTVETCIRDWLQGLGISPDGSTVVKLPNHRIIIAIDFGTTNSGYAFVLKDNDTIHVNSNWGGRNSTYFKVPTCILLDETGNFQKFGIDAQDAYTAIEDEEEAKKLLYFERFKMELHTSDGATKLSKGLQVEAANGKKVSALKVFSEVLRSIWMDAHGSISQSTANIGDLKISDVLWVITVPAIWSNEAKAFMREAALQAGLISNDDQKRLLFALEPEAASIFCTKKEAEAFEGTPDLPKQELGEQHIIVDAGGGTVDLTVHELEESSGLKEVQQASGGPWGGHSINLAVWKLLGEVFGSEKIAKLKTEAPHIYVEQGKRIEAAKLLWNQEENKGLRIEIFQGFADILEDLGTTVRSAIRAYNSSKEEDFKFRHGYLSIGDSKSRLLFDSTVNSIIDHIRKVMTQQRDRLLRIRRIFLVGGFALSKYLQHRIKDAFETTKLRVLVPLDSSTVVIKGAVLFGRHPSFIQQRVARLTYGMRIRTEFRKGVDPESKRVEGNRCDDRFHVFVRREDSITLGSVTTLPCHPISIGQKGMTVKLYSSPRKTVEHTTENECSLLGRIHLSFPSAYANLQDGMCLVVVCYGFTEINAMAIHVKTLKLVTENIDFLSD